jgi:hypothetical protein
MTRIETTTEELELLTEAARRNGVCASLLRDEGGTPVFLEVRDSNGRRPHRRKGPSAAGEVGTRGHVQAETKPPEAKP